MQEGRRYGEVVRLLEKVYVYSSHISEAIKYPFPTATSSY